MVYGDGGWDPTLYFRLDDNYHEIAKRIGADGLVAKLLAREPGLRLTRQDPWENLLMFVCSTNNNYKRIVRIVLALNSRFGKKVDTDFGKTSLFPTVKALSETTQQELLGCGLGYRAKHVLGLAKTLRETGLDLHSLKRKPYDEARRLLMELPGVGPKVADCVCLFSLEKLESFPIDSWIRRIVARFYPHVVGEELAALLADESKSLGPNRYWAVSQKMRLHFGEYAGYAQNQLYYHAKTLLKKRPAQRGSPMGGTAHPRCGRRIRDPKDHSEH